MSKKDQNCAHQMINSMINVNAYQYNRYVFFYEAFALFFGLQGMPGGQSYDKPSESRT